MIAALFREVVAGDLLAELILGSALLVLTAMVHGTGVTLVLTSHERQVTRAVARLPRHAVAAFSAMVLALLATHLLEIFLWALLLSEMGAIGDLRTAFYFSAVTYTTLGYQDIPFPSEYRILPALLALAGVFMIGWTTGVLFAVTNGLMQMHLKDRLDRTAIRPTDHAAPPPG